MTNSRLALLLIGILTIAILAAGAYIYTSKATSGKSSEKKEKKDKKKKDKQEDNDTAGSQSDCAKANLNAQQVWELPKELLEVSGITWTPEGKVAAVQDQEGSIFIYDLDQKKVERKISFGQSGDYEGIAMAAGNYFIVRSDGKLFEVAPSGKVIKIHDLPLTASDNIETLHHDVKNNRLILGQKDGAKGSEERHFYSFNLKTKTFEKTPIFTLKLTDEIIACGNANTETSNKKKKKKSAKNEIRPSELAIDPTSGDIYIADGPNQRILVLSSEYKPMHYLALDNKSFPQVEGLMFSKDGQLYLSTEGISAPAKIAKMQLSE